MNKTKFFITMCLSALFVWGSAQDKAIPSKGFAALSEKGNFSLINFQRHAVGDNDVLIDILYSGICHSDIHTAHSDWNDEKYPIIPGHEIAGRVVKVGKKVTKFKVGDYAGVGCMVNSCGTCEHCLAGEEQFCDNRKTVYTYASTDYFHNNESTMGGYSNNIVVSEKFALKIPANADMKRVAPLLCAGITTYSPIKFSHVKKGDQVAVAGFGGLGHLAVQYLVKLGAKVTVFDITEDKRADASRLGAMAYVNVNHSDELKGLINKFSFILSTIPAKYDPLMYVRMLKENGELAIVGLPARQNAPSINISSLVFTSHRKVYGSLIGGIPETQEMLDYSIKNNIYPEVEVIKADTAAIDQAYQKVINGQVKFRYVIDMKTLK